MLADPDYNLPEFQRLGGYRSIIGAPMIVDDEVVGVLIGVADHRRAVRRAHRVPC